MEGNIFCSVLVSKFGLQLSLISALTRNFEGEQTDRGRRWRRRSGRVMLGSGVPRTSWKRELPLRLEPVFTQDSEPVGPRGPIHRFYWISFKTKVKQSVQRARKRHGWRRVKEEESLRAQPAPQPPTHRDASSISRR